MKRDWREVADALAKGCSSTSQVEDISLAGASGRVLAKPLLALCPLPASTHAVMDGYALGSSPPDLYRLIENATSLEPKQACVVSAGGPIPEATVGIVLAGHTEQWDGHLKVSASLAKNNIRRMGEEAKLGEELLPAGILLDSRHIGLASMAGVQTLSVRQKPRGALIGLHDSGNVFPHAGIMHALLDSPALQLTNVGVVRSSHLQDILKRLSERNELVVVVSESLDAEDGLLAKTISALGGKTKIHRAALKPAKPIIAGHIGAAQIIGLAGTAYATTTAAHLFLQPMLLKMIGLSKQDDLMPVMAAFARSRVPGRAEALPAKLDLKNDQLSVSLAGRFGQLRALATMDGFALISATAEAITEGMPIHFKRLSFPLV